MNSTPPPPADSQPGSSPTTPDFAFSPVSHEQWLEAALAGLPHTESISALAKDTLEGLPVQPLYHHESVNEPRPDSDATAVQVESQLSNTLQTSPDTGWDNRLRSLATDDNKAANQAILRGLSGGIGSIELCVASAEQVAPRLQGVNLGIAPISLRAGNHYDEAAHALQQLLDEQPSAEAVQSPCFNADPLGHWLTAPHENSALSQPLKRMAGFAKDINANQPGARSLLVDLAAHHNRGASARQELHAALATGLAYLEALTEAGLSVQEACNQLVFQFACDSDVLMGVVKLRSFRQLWLHLVQQLDNLLAPNLIHTPLVVETSQRYLSRLDVWNNHLRNIAACTAAALGSADTVMVHPHDKIGQWQAEGDSEVSVRMARNLPIILEKESSLTHINDPMAGSYAIESLTRELVALTWQSLSETPTTEAWLQCLQSGHWHKALASTHSARVKALANDQTIMVGVNRYCNEKPVDDGKHDIATHEPDADFSSSPVRDSDTFELAQGFPPIEPLPGTGAHA